MDPILSSLTIEQLRFVEAELSNDEASSDAELRTHFVANGLTEAQAARALSYRTRYLVNGYLDGYTPTLKGDDLITLEQLLGHSRLERR